MSELKFVDCEACGNVLVPVRKRYCSECYDAIKAKETRSNDNLERRLAVLEKRVKKLQSGK